METETGHARSLAALSDAEVVERVVDELRKMYGADKVPAPTGSIVARLKNNSFLRGGFTHMPTGGTHELHRALAEPLAPVGYPAYISHCLLSHTADSVRSLVEAAVGDIARRFKNLHHKLSH